MTTAALKNRTHERTPQVGVMARTHVVATSLARELGISRPVVLSPTATTPARRKNLSALIVDEALWPLSADVEAAVLPTLMREGGYILRVLRVDPREKGRGMS